MLNIVRKKLKLSHSFKLIRNESKCEHKTWTMWNSPSFCKPPKHFVEWNFKQSEKYGKYQTKFWNWKFTIHLSIRNEASRNHLRLGWFVQMIRLYNCVLQWSFMLYLHFSGVVVEYFAWSMAKLTSESSSFIYKFYAILAIAIIILKCVLKIDLQNCCNLYFKRS